MKLILSDPIGSHKTNFYLLQEGKGRGEMAASCDRKGSRVRAHSTHRGDKTINGGDSNGAEVVAGIVDTQMLVESKHSVITCVQSS